MNSITISELSLILLYQTSIRFTFVVDYYETKTNIIWPTNY